MEVESTWKLSSTAVIMKEEEFSALGGCPWHRFSKNLNFHVYQNQLEGLLKHRRLDRTPRFSDSV